MMYRRGTYKIDPAGIINMSASSSIFTSSDSDTFSGSAAFHSRTLEKCQGSPDCSSMHSLANLPNGAVRERQFYNIREFSNDALIDQPQPLRIEHDQSCYR